MPNEVPSKFNQVSFKGGMNLLLEDSDLEPTMYRAGFDLTNRFGRLDPVQVSRLDTAVPAGIIQELITFGKYIIIFVGGFAYYRLYSDTNWINIGGFRMSSTAPRFWTCAVPVAVTNYYRIATTSNGLPSSSSNINRLVVAGAARGNLPGLLVQDNINQPYFIFLDGNGVPTTRVTQSFTQWSITFTDANNTTVAKDSEGNQLDFREYVPIGNAMCYIGGVLYVSAQDYSAFYRSVMGRPLDFVIGISNGLALNTTTQTWTYIDPITNKSTVVPTPAFTMSGGGTFSATNVFTYGGDATAASYSVGVGAISCLREMSTGALFVAAGNANFAVSFNTSQNAPTIFGEYTFLRQFLFNATCVDDRCIMDTLGDTRFIATDGIRSFNAVEQFQNEGKNSPFSATIRQAFLRNNLTLIQTQGNAASILFDDYELYAVNTIFGYVIAKYDTINACWVALDTTQTGGSGVRIFAKIELDIVSVLYAVTNDNKLYTLYVGPNLAIPKVRTVGVCASTLYANYNVKMNHPESETQLRNVRVIINNITANYQITFTPYVNNRLTKLGTLVERYRYVPPVYEDTDPLSLPDVGTQIDNILISTPDCPQGWKTFGVFTWSSGSLVQFSMDLMNNTPMQPLSTQRKNQ